MRSNFISLLSLLLCLPALGAGSSEDSQKGSLICDSPMRQLFQPPNAIDDSIKQQISRWDSLPKWQRDAVKTEIAQKLEMAGFKLSTQIRNLLGKSPGDVGTIRERMQFSIEDGKIRVSTRVRTETFPEPPEFNVDILPNGFVEIHHLPAGGTILQSATDLFRRIRDSNQLQIDAGTAKFERPVAYEQRTTGEDIPPWIAPRNEMSRFLGQLREYGVPGIREIRQLQITENHHHLARSLHFYVTTNTGTRRDLYINTDTGELWPAGRTPMRFCPGGRFFRQTEPQEARLRHAVPGQHPVLNPVEHGQAL